ncbi:MAG TPA: type II secretion system protein [Verrucomicrobiae bacterium]|nr:type II secretion system protein [Verrucomicrobiae bacterium]
MKTNHFNVDAARDENSGARTGARTLVRSNFLTAGVSRFAGALGDSTLLRTKVRAPRAGFTLLELLTVIAIIGILAALAAPILNNFKPNYRATATRQLLDDLGRARQLAISERTTVLMVFVPTNFWNNSSLVTRWGPKDWVAATNLFDKQLIGYNYVSLRSLGDQPGVHYPEYLSSWKTLPEGAFIPLLKFALPPEPPEGPNAVPFHIYTNTAAGQVIGFNLYGFNWTSQVPFPLLSTPTPPNRLQFINLPYIAFNYLGQRCDQYGTVIQSPAIFPLAKGSVGFGRDPLTKRPTEASPSVNEVPPGNATNSLAYNVVVVDWLTGRARAYQQEIR